MHHADCVVCLRTVVFDGCIRGAGSRCGARFGDAHAEHFACLAKDVGAAGERGLESSTALKGANGVARTAELQSGSMSRRMRG